MLTSVWRVLGRRLSGFVGFTVAADVYNDVYLAGITKLFRLGGAWHAKENSGNKVRRIYGGSENVKNFLVNFVSTFVPVLVAIPVIFVIVATVDWVITLSLVFFAITYGLTIRRVFIVGSRYGHAVKKEAEKLSGIAFESVNNIRTVQVGSLSQALSSRVKGALDTFLEFTHLRIRTFQLKGIPPYLIGNIFRVIILAFVAWGIVRGHYEVGAFVLIMGYYNHVWHVVRVLADLGREILDTRYGVWRLKEVLDSPDYMVDALGAKKFPKTWNTFSVNDVSFTYEDDQKTLHNVSFEVQKGKKIGLVGLSGAGKSTLFKLLTRERVPTKGQIVIDGLPVQDIAFADYFKNIGVMLQETELFSFTLKENVTLATGRANLARFQQAIEIAHVTDFLDKLPQGVDTKIGEKGFKLSGGERQRVGIARAIYHQPQILFFDEATSHLDVESEKKIQDALQKLFENTTAVVIAHRLSTIKEMDEILVMDKGKIIERGSFDELIKQQGRFYKLWQQQQL